VVFIKRRFINMIFTKKKCSGKVRVVEMGWVCRINGREEK
jgi:hypothetical protein